MTAVRRLSAIVLFATALAAPADERLDAAILKRVKDSSVLLDVLAADRTRAEGSGFFAVQQGVVVTNAHVVGMNVPGSKKPLSVTVSVNSGELGERRLPATVLGVDSRADLAVLRVEPDGRELPPPLPIIGGSGLQETQSVYVFGFPFGTALGRNISVRRATVSSLRRDSTGLSRIQVEGGIDQGNSGGPVVDPEGKVVAVSVSKLRGTQINFAIPGEKITELIRGKPDRATLGIAFRAPNAVHLPVRVPVVDPLGKIKKVVLESWTGKDDSPRPASASRPESRPGDSPRVALDLALKDGIATGEVPLPQPNPGESIWVQPRVELASGELAWDEARKVPNEPPVERKPAVLKFQPPAKGAGRVKIDLKSTGPLQVRASEELGRLTLDLSASADESSLAGRSGWNLTAATFLKRIDETPLGQINRENKPARVELTYNRDGSAPRVQLRQEPPAAAKADQTAFVEHLQMALAFATPPLPDKEMEPGRTWTAKVPVTINIFRTLNEAASADLTFTYEGVRPGIGGREETIVTSTGLVLSAAGKPGAAVNGLYVVDRESGRVTRGFARVDFELESSFNGRTVNLTGEVTCFLRRGLAADAPAAEEKK